MIEPFGLFSRRFQKKLNLEKLALKSATVEIFLRKVLQILAKEFPAKVATVYFWDDQSERLVLTATYGLNQSLEQKVKLKIGEGIVGYAMKALSPMILAKASQNSLFKTVDYLGEDRYDAYLVVPVEISGDKIGVMVLQRKEENPFTMDDLQAFKEVAFMVIQHLKSAGVVLSLHEEDARERLLDGHVFRQFEKHDKRAKRLKRPKASTRSFIGKKASATTFVAASGRCVIRSKHVSLSDFEDAAENKHFTLKDFAKAVKKTSRQISKLQISLNEHLSEWAQNIFVGHLLILKDEAYAGKIRQRIAEGISPPLAVSKVTRAFMRFFARSQLQSIREKTQDVKDLGIRILTNLVAGDEQQTIDSDVKGRIFVTRDLFPSELMFLKYEGAAGVVQLSSSNVLTSHMSLIAASLELPFMITQDEDILTVRSGERVLLDFEHSTIMASPSEKMLKSCLDREQERAKWESDHPGHFDKPVYTQDGLRIKVLANINLLQETSELNPDGVDGIGLYRSEFPFMVRNTFPTENEQYYLYKRIIASMRGREVAIRTLDVGGDKVLPYVSDHQYETNSILGLRAIRFTLKHREIFISQLKAILRAAHGQTTIKIILPLISSLEEVREAKAVLKEARDRLTKLGEPYAETYRLGIMVEVPSVVWILDELASEVDFFCIGTNDLVQYLLAVDRNNDMVANFYSHYHPSVLRMVKAVVTAAERHNIECTLCGQMAEDPAVIPFLLGIGLKRFSVSLGMLHRTRSRIRDFSLTEARILADKLLNASHVQETKMILKQNVPT